MTPVCGLGHRDAHPWEALKITEFKATAMRYGLCGMYRLVTGLRKKLYNVSKSHSGPPGASRAASMCPDKYTTGL